MGERTQIYVKIDEKVFLQYHHSWGYGFALIEDVMSIINMLGLDGYFREDIIDLINKDESYLDLDKEPNKFRFSQTPRTAFLEYIMCNPKKLIRKLKQKYPEEKDIAKGINWRFSTLIDKQTNKIQILGDNDQGGAFLDYNNYRETQKPSILFYDSEGNIINYDTYIEIYRGWYGKNFDIQKESYKNLLQFRYQLDLGDTAEGLIKIFPEHGLLKELVK